MMSTSNRNRALAAVLAAVMPFTSAVAADPVTAQFEVTMKVVADCTIGATGINFGQTGVITGSTLGQSNINVTCTNTTPYNVGLDSGTGAGSSGTTRFLVGSAGGNTDKLKVNLYRAPNAGLWGNTAGSDTQSGTGNGVAQTLTVYGEIPMQNSPTPDTYKSTITATIFF